MLQPLISNLQLPSFMDNVRAINYLEIIKRDWRKVLVVCLIAVLIALIITLVQPFLYRATVSIFVVQKSSFSIDAYSASKSEERIAGKLAQVVFSSAFFEKVKTSGFDIDRAYFPTDELKSRKQWNKMIESSVPSALSKLDISVYHKDPNQALNISKAIAYVLVEQKQNFIGIGDVDLKILDAPIVSKYPVKPSVVLNLIVGSIAGFILGLAFVIASYDPDRDKLFGIHGKFSEPPHLVMNEAVPESESVEEDMAEAVEIPEINDIEEAVDEVSDDRPLDAIGQEDDVKAKVELPGFSDEDSIVGMPDRGNQS